MHAAPPVRVTLGRSAAWSAFVALVWAAASANVSAWAALALQDSLAVAGAVAMTVAMVAAGASALQSWRTQMPGELLWDGQSWQWRGVACDVSVAVDAGIRLLLDVRISAGPRCWLVAERTAAGGDWHAFRAALYAAVIRQPHPALAA